MAERFFLRPNLKNFQLSSRITLLSGPPSSGKTSLLFQFAFNSALDGKTLFSCVIDASYKLILLSSLRYVDNDEEIKKYFAAFHLHDTFPVSVIIDDFVDFFDERDCQERHSNPRGRDLAMVRVLALGRNAICHANVSGPCELLLSDTHKGDSPRLLYIYKRWVSCIYTIKEGDGSGSFILKKSYSDTANEEEKSSAKYSIALQSLVLEGLTEEV